MASPVQIQLFSDLHLENPSSYDIFEITPKAPLLALLGDIGCVRDKGLLEFLKVQLQQFELVFFFLGNHEPYGKDFEYAKETIQKLAKQSSGKLIFLDQTRYDINDEVTVLGCTLYSNIGPTRQEMNAVSNGLNDFYQIQDWTVEQHNEAHATDLKWLNGQVEKISEEEPHCKVVIFTHHSPTQDPRAGDPVLANSPTKSGFSTDLAKEVCWKEKCVKVWAFGHTHFNCDYVDEETGRRVMTNQRGYYFSQSAGFEDGKAIDV